MGHCCHDEHQRWGTSISKFENKGMFFLIFAKSLGYAGSNYSTSIFLRFSLGINIGNFSLIHCT